MGLGDWMARLALGAGGVLGVAVALLYYFQEKLLYVPVIPGVPRDYYINPERYGLEAEDVNFTASDGVKLHAWMLGLKQWTPEFKQSRPVIIFFQENAGNMCFRLPFLRLMALRLECPILAVSYRGYGLSQGKPSEQGLQKDALAALALVRGRPDVDGARVIVFGRSLGGAVALHLAAVAQDQICALVIENTFTSVEEMVSRVMPPLAALIGPGKPCNWLVTNKWHNRDAIKHITRVPMLMMVSELDEMVPSSQMHRLHAMQRSPHCKLLELPGAHHMDAYDIVPEIYWPGVQQFVQEFAVARPRV